MSKRKSFLGLYFIISFVIIVAAVVVSLTAGLNLGSDIGGGTQFEVAIDGNVATSDTIKTVKNVLKENGVTPETVFVEDKFVNTVIVVRIADKKVENQAEIKADLMEKLFISEEDVSSFSTFSGTITKKAILWSSIAIVGLLLFLFAAGWVRYNIVAGLILVFTILHTLMLEVSLFVVTRLPITITSIIIMLSLVAVVVFALVLLLEKIKENARLKHNENISVSDLVDISEKTIIKPLILFAILLAVIILCFVCVPVRYITLTGCAMIVCLAACVYSYYFVGVSMYAKLLELKKYADKLKLSRNESPAPKKVKMPKSNKTKN